MHKYIHELTSKEQHVLNKVPEFFINDYKEKIKNFEKNKTNKPLILEGTSEKYYDFIKDHIINYKGEFFTYLSTEKILNEKYIGLIIAEKFPDSFEIYMHIKNKIESNLKIN